MEDSELRQRLERLEKMMLEIKTHFNIGTNVVRLADIREKARKAVERAKHGRKNPA
jgi:hypothetical protein